MNELIPFAFEEHLVRVVRRDGEPWFVGKDICECLSLKNYSTSLDSLDGDEKGLHSMETLAGRGGEQAVIIVSEPGVYRLVFRSRKPEAERFKRWLAHEVLPQLRKTGRFDMNRAANDTQPSLTPDTTKPMTYRERLMTVAEARAIAGSAVARVVWRQLGLPPMPPPPLTALDSARQCLRQLLETPADGEGNLIRDLVEAAMNECDAAAGDLAEFGMRVFPERNAFLVANAHTALANIFKGTEWRFGHGRVLRRLPGVVPFQGRIQGQQGRGALIPGDFLDDIQVEMRIAQQRTEYVA